MAVRTKHILTLLYISCITSLTVLYYVTDNVPKSRPISQRHKLSLSIWNKTDNNRLQLTDPEQRY